MIRRTAITLLISAATLAADDKDSLITLGKECRIGPISSGMTLLGVKTAVGANNMVPAELDGPEGTKLEGLKVYPGTDREFHLVLEQIDNEKHAVEAIVVGKAWKFANGLKAGLSIPEVEKINGKPFRITGFGWDLGGYGLFEGGTLLGKVTLRFDTKADNISDRITGDVQISSKDKDLLAAKPFVSEPISVNLRKDS
ncbi:MAG: hypothetical protein JNJ83_20605 [Verrucomicrobiaceae bacterium]|nr:hypothetical protein [Verrucomicrobiaceae bacterium]